ncbi:MAG: PKD domain-containing protein, partial [Candidatus Zixiibacteriota bacterium]
AAGNSNSSSPDYLGSRGDCLDVGATDKSGNPASFSNYGTWVDIAAPGVEVLSTITDPANPTVDYVAYMDGTSMACPHVAGVVALLESYNPSLSANDKKSIITNVANTRPYNKTKNVGVGLIDARKCLNAAGGGCDLAADFSGTPTSGCTGMTVNFTDLSTGTGIDGWAWTFGDGGTSSAQNPSYTYNTAGTFTVSLTVSSSSQGCNDTQTKTGYITVNGAPTADFSGTPTSGIEPLTVNFTNLSTGAASYSWAFGDGGTSTAQNPSHSYNAGTYTVTLTATNACGSDVETKTDYITVSPCVAPTAAFVGSPTSGYAPLTVNFTDLSTNATGWSWTFGDGGTSTAQNPSYTYTAEGIYTVTLTVTNSCGSDVATMPDYITVMASPDTYAYALSDIPVTGVVLGNYLDTRVSDNVYERITEVQYTGHPVKTYSYLEHKWTFDVTSGSTITFYLEAYRPNNSDGDNFDFSYSTDNVTYLSLVTVASAVEQVYTATIPNTTSGTVYVRVVDNNRTWGNVSLDPVYIDEMHFLTTGAGPQPPAADFVGSPTTGAAPLTVNFTDLSTGSPESWNWTFGDGGTSTVQNPSYTYNNIGTYTVSLTVTNAVGSDTNTKTGYIIVSETGATMHVHSMVVTRPKVGAYYVGQCVVTINDNNENPVNGAMVYVTATGPTSGTFNGLTGADGTVTFQTSGLKKPSGEWCFEVTNVTHGTLTYNAAENHVTKACESGPVFKGIDGTYQVLPYEFALYQNSPNPFNPITDIAFSLPEATYVTLEIYNIMGQRVATLVNGYHEAGNHTVTWDASSSPSGIYLYRIEAGQFTANRKMMLLK